MTGDLQDVISRLSSVLPKGWFAENSPNLTAVLSSIATPWVWLYNLLNYVIAQTRIGTATDGWLDLISVDYFGSNLTRLTDESDSSYRVRIHNALLQDAATRSAVEAGVQRLTGTPVSVFEPANCGDTGCYGPASGTIHNGTGMAYGQAGGWGSLDLPYQFFISVRRPYLPGVAMLTGYNQSGGGYGIGNISYIDLALLPDQITDANIRSTLCSLLPIDAVAWLRII